MQRVIFFLLLFIPLLSIGQEIDVANEKYPLISKIIVKSVEAGIHRIIPSKYGGYRGEYWLNEKGQVRTEKRYKWREHLATYDYKYDENGRLKMQIVSFDINHPKRIDITFYDYKIENGKIVREICYNKYDTLYRVDNLEFNQKDLKTKYLRNINESINFLKYETNLVTEWKQVNLKDSAQKIYLFKYDSYGNRISFDYQEIPEPPTKVVWLGVRGDGNHRKYHYKYDKKGYWIKKYGIYGQKKALLEKRKFIK